MMAHRKTAPIDARVLDILGKLAILGCKSDEDPTGILEAEVHCDDVTDFAEYLVQHVGRLQAVNSPTDWLEFLEEGARHADVDLASGCRNLLHLIEGPPDFGNTFKLHAGPMIATDDPMTTIARVYCGHEKTFGSAIDAWVRTASEFRREIEKVALRRLFYLSTPRTYGAGGMLVWLTLLDHEMQPRAMRDVWRKWRVNHDLENTVVITTAHHNSWFSFKDDAVFPMMRAKAFVSLLPLGTERKYVCDAFLSAADTLPEKPQAHRVTFVEHKLSKTDAPSDCQVGQLGWAAPDESPMPLFSTMDMFFGRRRQENAETGL